LIGGVYKLRNTYYVDQNVNSPIVGDYLNNNHRLG